MDQKSSPGKKVSNIQRIAILNAGLENARKILAADRVFPVLNKQGHYVVFEPQEGGYYLVDAEGCFIDDQRRSDLLEGSSEPGLAVGLFEEAPEEQGQPDENVEKVEAPTAGENTLSLTELLANGGNAEIEVAYSNGSYKSSY